MNEIFAVPSADGRGEAIRPGLLRELERLIVKHNHGSGNSIRVEEAEEIFRSMMYCVSFYLKHCPEPQETFAGMPGEDLFRRSLSAVQDEVKRAKLLYREAVETHIPTDLPVYCEMLRDALPAFFQLYDPELAAHETPTLMVYPLLQDPPDGLGGVEYIEAYLHEVIAENKMCRKYSRNYIRAVLLLYGRKYRLDYHELVVNIPEILREEKVPVPREAKEKINKNNYHYYIDFGLGRVIIMLSEKTKAKENTEIE